jgi:hypothetical protein
MPISSKFLSKSKYLSGLQCHKLLWHYYNAKDKIPGIDAGTQAIFDQGHLVGEYARKIYPEGIEVGKDLIEYKSVVEKTYEILRSMGVEIGRPADLSTLKELTNRPRKPLFEAAFLYKNAYARADILVPIERGYNRSPTKTFGDDDSLGSPTSAIKKADAENAKIRGDVESLGSPNDPSLRSGLGDDEFLVWDIIEVKSSTTVKEINLHDLALQWYTYSGAGLTINKCYLMHINNKYVRDGEIDPKQLFIKEDVTDRVISLLDGVEQNLEAMVNVVEQKNSPRIPIGPWCSYPYECIMTEVCWNFLPKHHPHTLTRLSSDKAFALIDAGVLNVLDIGKNVKLTDKQQIQIESIRTNRAHIEKEEIKAFLDRLEYPLYYLDFETVGSAVPVYDKTRPFEQIPFQFSLHIQKAPGSPLEHVGFLAEGREDPRAAFLAQLKKHLGTKGTILTYNAAFEKGRLNEATAIFTEYKKWNEMIQARIVDLLGPFRSFHYYHPDQLGSASIKSVLPAVTGKGYDGMEISDGGTASSEYLRVTFGEEVSKEESRRVRKNLVEYCTLDTMAMVDIVEELRKIGG